MDRPMITDNWCGYNICFVQMDDGEWWAVLKDICDALDLQPYAVARRIYAYDMRKEEVDRVCDPISSMVTSCEKSRARKSQVMLLVNEQGILDCLLDSRRLEAKQFRRWVIDKLRDIRQFVGLQQHQVLHITERCYLEDVDMFWDDEAEKWRKSHMLPNGDVEVEEDT